MNMLPRLMLGQRNDAGLLRKMMSGIPTLSLFSGAGGLDIGFAQAGYDIRACVEIEPSYARTLRANAEQSHQLSNDSVIHCEDIRDFDPSPYIDAGIRCIIGGPPCQTFSAAGRRSGGVIGTDDARGKLFESYCKLLAQIQPEVFVFENVYGLPGANGGGPWREIVRSFAAVGYELRAEVIDTADYGVPQHRERLIMVGFKTGDFKFPMPTHGPDSSDKVALVSVEDAISDLQDPHEPVRNGLGGMYGHLLPEVPEGLNYAFFTAEMGHPHPVFAWRSKFHDLLYKVKRDEPCRTIKAQPGKFTGPFHWKNRHFTTQELKRLQTFPDDYDVVGSYGKVVEQIGNSVPPRLAYVIAVSVREQLIEPTSKLQFVTRPDQFRSTFRQRQRQRSARFAELAKAADMSRTQGARHVESRPDVIDRYSLNPEDLFDKRKHRHQNQSALIDYPHYEVTIVEDGHHLDLQVIRQGLLPNEPTSSVSITGLSKYFPDINSCTLMAQVAELEDVFHCWNVVEEALVSRSRFFTLIDIYGHYANKGDAVQIDGVWRLMDAGPMTRLLNRISCTDNCGTILNKQALLSELGFNSEELVDAVNKLRSYRFDVRTERTHPILGKDRILCTYPFPLLSPRALVSSKARVERRITGGNAVVASG